MSVGQAVEKANRVVVPVPTNPQARGYVGVEPDVFKSLNKPEKQAMYDILASFDKSLRKA